MSLADFQRRLAAVELEMGIDASSKGDTNNNDLVRRLDMLEHQLAAKLRPHELQEVFAESERLFEELSPGAALTYQTDVSAPLMYRKQMVLASAPDTLDDLDQLASIYSLVAIGQDIDNNTESLTEDQIVNAPILSVEVSQNDKNRLETCVEQFVGMQKTVEQAAAKLDAIVDEYQRLVSATSALMLALDEELRRQESRKASESKM
ncbi:hypothetical protein MPSEU_000329000 [Mayamaea pseudoterrestris]|nr:hypothetical protein MPSEU_000329000 [Mayamaea pseudoterrestris]